MVGRALLERNTQDLLGPAPHGRWTRIMVTLPSEAATDADLVDTLVAAGMNVARINCAHDGPEAWAAMAANVRVASERQGCPVRIAMDLAGPKLRTAEIPVGPSVVKVRPMRDAYGRTTAPGRLVLIPAGRAVEGAPSLIGVPISPEFFDSLSEGDELHVVDTREAQRTITIRAVRSGWVLAEVAKTTYLDNGTELYRRDGVGGRVEGLPPTPGSIVLEAGNECWLMSLDVPEPVGASARPRVGCTLPEAIASARIGQRVFFDDGKIGGTVVEVVPGGLGVRITQAPPGGARLRNEKGINLPDTDIPIPALTVADLEALATVVRVADVVNLSFVRSEDDVRDLQSALAEREASSLGIVLKIETLSAFRNLPEIVMQAMASEHVGVMIARGDLAVEVGYERLAEVQEEVLWLCEAAHLPVIWATQVLDTLARTGQPSRAEITDAAMSERADCVMLNKGPHIARAISTLDDILRRMASHQSKKRPLLRPLRSWIRE